MNNLWLISIAAIGFLIWYSLIVLNNPFKGFLIMLPFMIITRTVDLPFFGERLIFFDILLVIWWLGVFSRATQGYRDLRFNRSVFWPVFTYYMVLVAAFASLLNGQFVLRGIYELLIYFFLGLFGVATIGIIHSKEQLIVVAKWSIGVLFLATGYALWEIVSLQFGLPILFSIESARRLSGAFRQTNQLASFLRTLLPLAWSMLLLNKGSRRTKILLSVATAGSMFALLMTSSRANLIATMFELALLLSVATWITLKNRKLAPIISVSLTIGFIMGAIILAPQMAGTYYKTFLWRTLPLYQSFTQSASPDTMAQAFAVAANRNGFIEGNWGTAWQAFQDHPVFGVGIGNFGPTYESFRGEHQEVHSGFLGLLAERGIMGSIPMIFFLIMGLWYAAAGLVHRNRILWLAVALLVSYLGSNVVGVYVVFFRRREFWLIFGLIIASWYVYEEAVDEVPESDIMDTSEPEYSLQRAVQ